MPGTARNVELKARDLDPARSLLVCRALGAEDQGELWQRDTYFLVPHGRLKLREQRPGAAHLIQYERADCPAERESRYHVAAVEQAEAMKTALAAALAVRVVVTKRPRLFLHGPIRIHLDHVESLGHFLELEAVATVGSDLTVEHRLVDQLRNAFGISDDQLVAVGNADQLEHKS